MGPMLDWFPVRLSSIISFCDADGTPINRAVQESRMPETFSRDPERRISASDRGSIARRSRGIWIEFPARIGMPGMQGKILEEHILSAGLQLRSLRTRKRLRILRSRVLFDR
jgi:hypothetical protein